jgi:hypothetical protein
MLRDTPMMINTVMANLQKYKKMIKDSSKPFYDGCAVRYTRLFMMVKIFQLKASNG